ncbi:MAG: type II toxin-antitoxin system RelE/ParE family toxin [Segetibacter sp.]
MAEIVWTATALNYLDSIAAYIFSDSTFYAKLLVQKIFLATEKLEKHSGIEKIIPELPAYNYREIIFKRYRIIYRVNS